MKTYTFEFLLFAAIHVKADTETAARAMLREHLSCADCNGGVWPDGTPILFEAGMTDDHADLIEIDGESVE